MTPRLLITMLLDNSAAIQGKRFDEFKAAFEKCLQKFKETNPTNIDLEIIAYDEFSPKVLKAYRDEDFKCKELEPFKMPFLGKAIEVAIKDMSLIDEYYGERNVPIYKPWLFILTEAYSFDEIDNGVNMMKEYFKNQKVLYMPFLLSHTKISQNVEELTKLKPFMKIKDNSYEAFFEWFFNMAIKRASTPPETAVKFDRSDFEGWAIL